MALIECNECGKEVSDKCMSCPGCGNPINQVKKIMVNKEYYGLLAFFLSLIIPGAGQLYKGQVISAILWFLFVPIGYFCFIFPGLLLHVICIFEAALNEATVEREVITKEE